MLPLPLLLFLFIIYTGLLGNYRAFGQTSNRLLPPPPITPRVPKPKVKEYVYTIPIRKKAPTFRFRSYPTTVKQNKYTFYRVEIPGDCPKLLKRVKKVEPRAFIGAKKDYIQAGVFQNITQAEQSVKKLNNIGLLAKIVKIYR